MATKIAHKGTTVLVGTRKGLFVLRGDARRRKWHAEGPHFLGQIVNHAVLNPATGTILVAARAGHLGPTVFRSVVGGKQWKEASAPPAFPKSSGDAYGWSVAHVFWLTPGHVSEPMVWYAGTSPHGLFRSADDGITWQSVDGFNLHPDRPKWLGGSQEAPPDGAILHSINVDPFDKQHIYVAMSAGGVFESFDAGASWKPLNRGCAAEFLPDPNAEYGHDPHCVAVHPLVKDVVYQQNHCGIYRLDRSANRWQRIGDNMPREIGDIGFPVVLHPRDPKTLWVFPMDGTSVWPRISIAGKPAVYCSRDAGASWQRQDKGLPPAQAWFTVKRQAMAADQHKTVGLYFGTTSGEVWSSFDEGANWQCLMLHLPHIYSVEAWTA
jgi:photosystem II stability/assembly factor-like uncharacterized protein